MCSRRALASEAWAREGFVRGSSVASVAWARQGFVSGSHLRASLDIAPTVDIQRELLDTPGRECAQPRRELGGECECNHLQRDCKQLLQTCQIRV